MIKIKTIEYCFSECGYIYRDTSNKTLAKICIYYEYCKQNIIAFQKAIENIKKTFPEVNEDEIVMGYITEESYLKGLTVFYVISYIEKKKYNGWEVVYRSYSDFFSCLREGIK